MMHPNVKAALDLASQKKANILIRSNDINIFDLIQVTEAHGTVDARYVDTHRPTRANETLFKERLDECRSEGSTLITGRADHLSGISMYQVWEALNSSDGYHKDFHMVLVVDEYAPVEYLDSAFRQMFGVLNEDGTFYREVEHA